ncbi:two-component sensor kinase, putative [Babesia ovata]|uniref:Two-component sensor kinase, putative n=1 Tax=Babesia ovata TaxID=189622 RepID=A0A2H6KCU0_9APIC|nr:two-component sensor kinase, putative [Babesia ovata]GBE60794.1 two-component sensor kinase, putative [Babesia ovata]
MRILQNVHSPRYASLHPQPLVVEYRNVEWGAVLELAVDQQHQLVEPRVQVEPDLFHHRHDLTPVVHVDDVDAVYCNGERDAERLDPQRRAAEMLGDGVDPLDHYVQPLGGARNGDKLFEW